MTGHFPAEAQAAIAFLLGWGGEHLPLFVDDGRRGQRTRWLRRPFAQVPTLIAAVGDRVDAEISAGVACRSRELDDVLCAAVLWVWVQGSDQVGRAHRFRPAPSVVLRFGGSSRRLLLWGLNDCEPVMAVEAANRRLAYALHAPQKWAQVERLRVPLPGTFLRWGRARPVPVLVSRLETAAYDPLEVVGRLREVPSANAWRERR